MIIIHTEMIIEINEYLYNNGVNFLFVAFFRQKNTKCQKKC